MARRLRAALAARDEADRIRRDVGHPVRSVAGLQRSDVSRVPPEAAQDDGGNDSEADGLAVTSRVPRMKRLALVGLIALSFPVSAQHQRPESPPDRLPPPALAPLRAAANGQVGILPVQGNIYMLNLGDANIVAQVGLDGILLVD